MHTYDRPLTDDERAMLRDWSLWGAAGYPIVKRGRRWTWHYRSLSAPTLSDTKRAAVAAYERYIGVLIECSGAEAERRATGAA